MKYLVFALLSMLLVSSVFGLGLGTPPQKSYKVYIGQNLTIDITIINDEGKANDYGIALEGDLKDRAVAVPSSFFIQPKDKFHSGSEKSRITINSEGILPGTYTLKMIAESKNTDSDLAIIQQVIRTVDVSYEYPPSVINKILNFAVLKIKQLFSYILNSIKNIYKSNPWINYLFLAVVLVLFFYGGTRAGLISKWLKRKILSIIIEIERMIELGFFRWLKHKIRNTFKKLKNKLISRNQDEFNPINKNSP